ncbi:MAG: hypothetical protein WAM97_04105, partial [Acidimicrobiales bacterium]
MDALVVGHIPPGDLFSSGEALDLSEADIRLSIGAVQEPDLRRGLDELGMVGPVRARRRGVEIELIIPSEHWLATDQLVERVRQAVVPADPRIEVRVMNPEERTALL